MAGAREWALRANPSYQLVVFDRLTRKEQQLVGDPALVPHVYGALRPCPGSGLPLRPVSRDLALLFLTLLEPGPLPAYASAEFGLDAERSVAKLVLDGVIEIERGGEFVTGAQATNLIASPAAGGLASGRIGLLSIAALRYGAALAELPAEALQARLYRYGCEPQSPALLSRFPDSETIDDYLGVPPLGSSSPLRGSWIEARGGDAEHWRLWYPVSPEAPAGRRAAEHKLYVSPVWSSLREALHTTLDVLATCSGVAAVKHGRGLDGILRPDKLVAYFHRLEDLHHAAERLVAHSVGWNAHGVPFTASITADGALSWGLDPPPGVNRGSWRLWLTMRLARYLVAARASPTDGVKSWEFALERVRLDGVDTKTWVPEPRLWDRILGEL